MALLKIKRLVQEKRSKSSLVYAAVIIKTTDCVAQKILLGQSDKSKLEICFQ